MNCHEAEEKIFAERDGALDELQRAAFASHMAGCASCRRVRDDLSAGIETWRASLERVRVPDAELEWQKLRREIRGGAGSTASHRRPRLAWFALPLGAAAIAAVALFVNPNATNPPSQSGGDIGVAAGKNSGASDDKESTVVFVDDNSGWTFVWADNEAARHI